LNQIEKWREVLKSTCNKTFKKIRISKKRFVKPLKKTTSKLIDKRNKMMKNKDGLNLSEEIEQINEKISNIEAKENRDLILKNFKSFSENPEAIDLKQVWKTLKKIWPKHGNVLLTAKRNHKLSLVLQKSKD
jgi:hypothetical protein